MKTPESQTTVWSRIVSGIGGVHQFGRLWIIIHDNGISIAWRQIERWRWDFE